MSDILSKEWTARGDPRVRHITNESQMRFRYISPFTLVKKKKKGFLNFIKRFFTNKGWYWQWEYPAPVTINCRCSVISKLDREIK